VPTLRFDHIGLTSRDPHAAARFYERLFGLERLEGRPPPGTITLRGGGIELVVSPGEEGTGADRPAGDHFGFSAPLSELDAFLALLQREGVKHQRVDTRVYFRDLDGYVLEVDFGE
jgi:catechol 2,3-dioxygenase-like lactoylglutathione lyase family enzyme